MENLLTHARPDQPPSDADTRQGAAKPTRKARPKALLKAPAGPTVGRPLVRKGRGAVSNASGRYEREQREAFDDGWAGTQEEAPAPLHTSVTADRTRKIITRNESPDLGFDRSINPYRGCEHGCVYCFARPTHAFLGLSPGLDFESKLFAKPDAPALLRKELQRAGYKCRPIAMGTNTDPYQPIERDLKVTRGILEVLREFNHPVSIVTKSAGVTRDLDILADMARDGLAKVAISVTTLDAELARKLEPRAPTPAKRLAAIRSLSAARVPTVVMAAPVIPVLTDPELETILAAAADAGAGAASYVMLRLPLEIKELFEEWLSVHAPLKRDHILERIRDLRAGRLNDPDFFTRQRGTGPYADLIQQRFVVATRKLGLRRDLPLLDTSRFAPPAQSGEQLSLF